MLAAFRDNCAELKGIQRGIEKESLRVTVDGALSRQPHPLTPAGCGAVSSSIVAVAEALDPTH